MITGTGYESQTRQDWPLVMRRLAQEPGGRRQRSELTGITQPLGLGLEEFDVVR
jgi:hypothetical protein